MQAALQADAPAQACGCRQHLGTARRPHLVVALSLACEALLLRLRLSRLVARRLRQSRAEQNPLVHARAVGQRKGHRCGGDAVPRWCPTTGWGPANTGQSQFQCSLIFEAHNFVSQLAASGRAERSRRTPPCLWGSGGVSQAHRSLLLQVRGVGHALLHNNLGLQAERRRECALWVRLQAGTGALTVRTHRQLDAGQSPAPHRAGCVTDTGDAHATLTFCSTRAAFASRSPAALRRASASCSRRIARCSSLSFWPAWL